MITSRSNPRIKEVLRLRKSSVRRETGRFLIDGREEIQIALANHFEIESIFGPEGFGQDSEARRPFAGIANEALFEVEASILARITYGQRREDFVAVAVTPSFSALDLKLHNKSLVLVLVKTEKPGNVGACLRTASAANADAVILVDPICEPLNPNAIRGSRGHVFRTPLAICKPEELRRLGSETGLQIICTRIDAEQSLWETDLSTGSILVFGNEAAGLEREWDELCDATVKIPMAGAIDSLNLSNSAAVVLYEAARQRGTSHWSEKR